MKSVVPELHSLVNAKQAEIDKSIADEAARKAAIKKRAEDLANQAKAAIAARDLENARRLMQEASNAFKDAGEVFNAHLPQPFFVDFFFGRLIFHELRPKDNATGREFV